MAPIIEVSDDVLKGLNQLHIPYQLKDKIKPEHPNFTYVPSLDLYFEKEPSVSNLEWEESHKKFNSLGGRMARNDEFDEFFGYIESIMPKK